MTSRESLSAARSYHSWYGGERRQSWATPPALFDRLNERFAFTLDGASEPGNGLLPRASTAENEIAWEGERVFCNPPWSNIPPFVEKAATAALAVLLVPARTNCRWFHRALALGADPQFFLGKPKFVGAKHTSPVDCLLLVWDKTTSRPEALDLSLDDRVELLRALDDCGTSERAAALDLLAELIRKAERDAALLDGRNHDPARYDEALRLVAVLKERNGDV